MADVFLSYSRRDSEFVDRLVALACGTTEIAQVLAFAADEL